MTFIEWLKENIKMYEGNKKNNESGITYGFFSSNFRGKSTLNSKLEKLNNIFILKKEELWSDSGQSKLKDGYYNIFIELNILNNNKDALTDNGTKILKRIFENNDNELLSLLQNEFFMKWNFNTGNALFKIKNDIISTFNNSLELRSQLVKFKNKKLISWERALLISKLSLMRTKQFHDFLKHSTDSMIKEVVSIISTNEKIMNKFNPSSSCSSDTILDIIDLANTLNDTKVEYNPKNNRRQKVFLERIVRDKSEVEKVNERSKKLCEICKTSANQFTKVNGEFYNEVHHIFPLSKLKSNEEIIKKDKANFMISLCPLHHREIHHGENANQLMKKAKKILKLDD